jgi:DNA modification methylase
VAEARLILGEALEALRGLESGSVDAVVTDPPYGINTKSDGSGKLDPWADLCNAAFWYAAWIGECRRVLRPDGSLWSCLNWRSLVTFQKASCDLGWPIESLLVWDKCWPSTSGPKALRPHYELVALWAMPDFLLTDRRAADVQRFKWTSHKPNGHPAEKPVDLMTFAVRHGCREGGLVLDPFAGSATTGVAALAEGRDFIGVESNRRYHAIASRRLAEAAALAPA